MYKLFFLILVVFHQELGFCQENYVYSITNENSEAENTEIFVLPQTIYKFQTVQSRINFYSYEKYDRLDHRLSYIQRTNGIDTILSIVFLEELNINNISPLTPVVEKSQNLENGCFLKSIVKKDSSAFESVLRQNYSTHLYCYNADLDSLNLSSKEIRFIGLKTTTTNNNSKAWLRYCTTFIDYGYDVFHSEYESFSINPYLSKDLSNRFGDKILTILFNK